jgi:hypothetical protein
MEDRLNRRALLRGGGMAAAAAAATVGTSVVTAGPAAADPLVPIYLPYGPERVYDSREDDGRIGRNQTRNVLAGFSFPEEFAFCFNVTLTGTVNSAGFLAVFPGDETWNGTSSINWDRQGQTIANNAFTWLSFEDGSVNVHCGTSTGGSTHFILDLIAIASIYDAGAVSATSLKAAKARARTARA